MQETDRILMKRLLETQKNLHRHYDSIDTELLKRQKVTKSQDVHLQILSFENIIKECQSQVFDNSLEEIEATLSLVYHVNMSQNGTEEAIKKLHEIATIYLSSKRKTQNIDEHLLEDYRTDMELVTAAIKSIENRLYYFDHLGWKWLFRPKQLLKDYQLIKEDLETLSENMSGCYEIMHYTVTEHIVESFHYIYLYFLYLISYFRAKCNETAILEVVAVLDRFIEVMKPLSESINLKKEHLRNSYVVYELTLLKDELLSFYA